MVREINHMVFFDVCQADVRNLTFRIYDELSRRSDIEEVIIIAEKTHVESDDDIDILVDKLTLNEVMRREQLYSVFVMFSGVRLNKKQLADVLSKIIGTPTNSAYGSV